MADIAVHGFKDKLLASIKLDIQFSLNTVKDKQYAEYMQFLEDKRNGRILQPLTLRSICQSYNYNPTEIGQHFLELLPRILTPEEQEPWKFCENENGDSEDTALVRTP